MTIRKILLGLAAVCALSVSAGAAVSAKTVELSEKKITMDVSSSAGLTLNNAGKDVTWKSSNEKIVAVKGNGKTAKLTAAAKTGTVTITATEAKKNYTCQVKVAKFKMASTLKLTTGSSKTLKLKGAASGTVKWKTSNKKVAAIASGNKNSVKVTAGSKTGKAVITATVNKKSYTCKVTVSAPDGSEKLPAVTGSWTPADGYWYFTTSNGRTPRNEWVNTQGPTLGEYWSNYSYYHGNLYFDANGRWVMTKNSRIKFDTTLTVMPQQSMASKSGKGPKVQQAVYKLTPVKKIGYYQWFMKGSTKYDDARPVYAVKKPVYIKFGAGNSPYWSIQMSGLKWEIADEKGIKKGYSSNNVIGWIGDKAIVY